MLRILMKSKIHRATVTECDLAYMGSLAVDTVLMEAANLCPNEKVQVVNLNTGVRFETYLIEGEPGSGKIGANGGAARLVEPGDLILIISYAFVDESEVAEHEPRVILVDENNRLVITS